MGQLNELLGFRRFSLRGLEKRPRTDRTVVCLSARLHQNRLHTPSGSLERPAEDPDMRAIRDFRQAWKAHLEHGPLASPILATRAPMPSIGTNDYRIPQTRTRTDYHAIRFPPPVLLRRRLLARYLGYDRDPATLDALRFSTSSTTAKEALPMALENRLGHSACGMLGRFV